MQPPRHQSVGQVGHRDHHQQGQEDAEGGEGEVPTEMVGGRPEQGTGDGGGQRRPDRRPPPPAPGWPPCGPRGWDRRSRRRRPPRGRARPSPRSARWPSAVPPSRLPPCSCPLASTRSARRRSSSVRLRSASRWPRGSSTAPTTSPATVVPATRSVSTSGKVLDRPARNGHHAAAVRLRPCVHRPGRPCRSRRSAVPGHVRAGRRTRPGGQLWAGS